MSAHVSGFCEPHTTRSGSAYLAHALLLDQVVQLGVMFLERGACGARETRVLATQRRGVQPDPKRGAARVSEPRVSVGKEEQVTATVHWPSTAHCADDAKD